MSTNAMMIGEGSTNPSPSTLPPPGNTTTTLKQKRKHDGDAIATPLPNAPGPPSSSSDPGAGPSPSGSSSAQPDSTEIVWNQIEDMLKMSKSVEKAHQRTQQELRSLEEGNRRLVELIEKKRQRTTAKVDKNGKTKAGTLPATELVSKRKLKKDLDRMMRKSPLETAMDTFGLPERNEANFVSAIQLQLVNLLRVEGLTRRHISDFPDPDSKVVKAFMQSNDAIDFTNSQEFCYSLSLGPSHPFNVAARAAFHDHFRLTVTKTNWLYQKPFDRRLLMHEIIEEVLFEKLKRAKHAWDTRFTFVSPSPEVKQKKRIGSRVYEIRNRRNTALDLHEAVAKFKPVFQSLDKGGLNVHSEDNSDEEGGDGDEEMETDADKEFEVPDVKSTARGLLPWRSMSLTILLWFLDEVANLNIINTVAENDGIRLGNVFRRRKLFLEFGKSRRIPSRLPINWYSRSFVRGLEPWELEILQPAAPQPIEGIELIMPKMADEVSKEELVEFLQRLKDADMADMDHNSMETD